MAVVRDATPHDAVACAAVYAPYVTESAISFEDVPPTAAEMARRITAAQRRHAWLVLEDDDGAVVGYAYAGPYKERAAYRWSCEVSVYLAQGRGRAGGGRLLYGALFDRLAERGYRTLVAGLTQPNEASEAFHRAMGFEVVGTWRAIGWKHGRWRDVTWVQRPMTADGGPPSDLR